MVITGRMFASGIFEAFRGQVLVAKFLLFITENKTNGTKLTCGAFSKNLVKGKSSDIAATSPF